MSKSEPVDPASSVKLRHRQDTPAEMEGVTGSPSRVTSVPPPPYAESPSSMWLTIRTERHVTPCAPARRTYAFPALPVCHRSVRPPPPVRPQSSLLSQTNKWRSSQRGRNGRAAPAWLADLVRYATDRAPWPVAVPALICGDESDRPLVHATLSSCPMPFGLDDCHAARSFDRSGARAGQQASVAPPFAGRGRARSSSPTSVRVTPARCPWRRNRPSSWLLFFPRENPAG